ncbi:MAG: DEAD/DEAH box helicase [Methanobacteriaceae archaeon]|jgi:DEAD/DEAH box helicase domain-containing protein|nr:DEAD/DEAH box helicase [Candidatus Methanorudis spinitermitis]
MDKLAIDKFKNDIRFKKKIAHVETIPSKKANYKKIANLNDSIADYLKKRNIRLYEHQTLAYEKIKSGKNVIITTPTASGKTLAFNLPILEKLKTDLKATAMYIYPAKALSNDQLNVLKDLEEELNINIKPATYDGDTEKSKKYNIRQNSRIILTNPYQLHHILSWHHQWAKFYRNLKYVVIDEAHYYKGVFGSNVAFLIRRLKRIANFYGSHPQFILSSATLANPKELATKLVGETFHLIDKDGSPSGEKDFILYNPFYRENLNGNSNNKKSRNGTLSIHQETEHIFLYLMLKNIQTLCFTVSRKIAELIAMWAKKEIYDHKKTLIEKITAYRAGYLSTERREIESGLKSRKYLGVTCTNALELGINIGSLDAVIISGYPGTMISTWQQAGRAGRKNQKSLVVLLAFENQLDQYFMQNPDFFFDKTHENAIIDLNNNMIILSHVLCAANELPLSQEELSNFFKINNNQKKYRLINEHFNREILNLLNELEKKKELVKNSNGMYIYSKNDQPSFNHSLDQLSNDVYKVMNDNQLLEIMERSQVYREAHEGAVLINKGETYIVDNINLKNHYVNVSKRAVDYHTLVLKDVEININKKIKREKIGDFKVNFGELEVSEDFYKYKKMHFSKTIGTYFLDLPPLTFKTKGIWFTIPEKIKKYLEKELEGENIFTGGLHGVEHALIGLFPLHVMCDRFDIGGLSTNYHEDTQEATIFIYDAYEGGMGICEKAIEVFKDLVQSTENLIKTCQCVDGCPSCIYSPKCGNDNKPLHKDATKHVLSYINEKIAISINDEKNSKGADEKTINSVKTFDRNLNKKFNEALEFYEKKNYSYAKDILVDIIDTEKNYSDAWYLLGAILNMQGDTSGASNFLMKTLSINPSHENASDLLKEIKSNSSSK